MKLFLDDDLDVLGAGRVGRSEGGREEEEGVELGRAAIHHDEAVLVGADRVARYGGFNARHYIQQTLEEIIFHEGHEIGTLRAYRLVRFPNDRQVVSDSPVNLPVEYDEGQDWREEEVKASNSRESPQDAECEAANALNRHREQDVLVSLICSATEMRFGRCPDVNLIQMYEGNDN